MSGVRWKTSSEQHECIAADGLADVMWHVFKWSLSEVKVKHSETGSMSPRSKGSLN